METELQFQVKATTNPGENISVVGNDNNLGNWDVMVKS